MMGRIRASELLLRMAASAGAHDSSPTEADSGVIMTAGGDGHASTGTLATPAVPKMCR